MREQTQVVDVDQATPAAVDLEQFASYEDDDGFVICDRKNPNAWIKAETTEQIER